MFLLACNSAPQPEPTVPDPALQQRLADMVKVDQEIQQFFYTAQDSLPLERRDFLRDSVFRHNGELVKEIFKMQGYPDTTLVGPEGQHQFWLLVQHMDYDPTFQEEVLVAMRPLVDRQAVSAVDFAYLTDRVRLAKGEKQWYGTQLDYLDNMMAVPQPLADSLTVNVRRAAIGLGSVEAYLNKTMELHFRMNKAFYASLGRTTPYHYEEK